MNIRRTAAAVTSAAALSVTGVAMAQPAAAAPVFTGGLVNVNVSDIDVDLLNDSLNKNDVRILNNVLNDNQVSVGVVAQVAAQVCNTNVGGILGELRTAQRATCETAYGPIEFTTTR
jgi:hypothetical protein